VAKKVKNPDDALQESPKTAESQFLRFTWVAVVLLAVVLGGLGLFYATCDKAKQEPIQREPTARQVRDGRI
jgi:hypothetical protein